MLSIKQVFSLEPRSIPRPVTVDERLLWNTECVKLIGFHLLCVARPFSLYFSVRKKH